MELVFFHEANSKAIKTGERTIRIGRKSGLISFSKTATEELSITSEDKLVFVQDKKSPTDWYFYKTSDKVGFSLRTKGEAAAFNCSSLAIKILDSVKIGKSVGFLIAKEPEMTKHPETNEELKLYAILTTKPLNPK